MSKRSIVLTAEMKRGVLFCSAILMGAVLLAFVRVTAQDIQSQSSKKDADRDATADNAVRLAAQGRQVFRFDTFGDQTFWGDTLKLHQAIEGSKLGGVGPGVSPKLALEVGLKVDVDALPRNLFEQLRHGSINLNDPAVTVALIKLNAVVGVTGFFDSAGGLKSVGIQCALCHSTVDNSTPALCAGAIHTNPGTGCVGHRLDGWANRDLNVGEIIALAPDLSAFADLLSTTQSNVRAVLKSWGPGKFDAELALDGKAFNPQQVTDGIVTGTNISGASLIPPAFGLGGVNLHTWTGWGSVPYWNAFVANLEMHGAGRFWDPRLNDATQFPIAAAHGSAIFRTFLLMTIRSHQNFRLFSSISLPFLHHSRHRAALIRLQQTVVTNFSAARLNVIAAMSNHSGLILGGICTRLPRSVLTASKLTARQITVTGLRRSGSYLRTEREGSTTTGGSGHWQMLLITTIAA